MYLPAWDVYCLCLCEICAFNMHGEDLMCELPSLLLFNAQYDVNICRSWVQNLASFLPVFLCQFLCSSTHCLPRAVLPHLSAKMLSAAFSGVSHYLTPLSLPHSICRSICLPFFTPASRSSNLEKNGSRGGRGGGGKQSSDVSHQTELLNGQSPARTG